LPLWSTATLFCLDHRLVCICRLLSSPSPSLPFHYWVLVRRFSLLLGLLGILGSSFYLILLVPLRYFPLSIPFSSQLTKSSFVATRSRFPVGPHGRLHFTSQTLMFTPLLDPLRPIVLPRDCPPRPSWPLLRASAVLFLTFMAQAELQSKGTV